MAYSYTSRLELPKPDPNDLYNIDAHNDAMDILDNIGGVVICNTAGRPTDPYLWQTIYDTDEHAQFTWDGSAWEQVTAASDAVSNAHFPVVASSGGRPGSPLSGDAIFRSDKMYPEIYRGSAWERMTPGQVGGKIYTTAATLATVSTTETKIMETGSLDLDAGRFYKLKTMVEVGVATANANLLIRMRVTNTSGSLLSEYRTVSIPVASRRSHFYFETLVTSGSAGSVNFITSILRGDGSGNVMAYGSGSAPFMILEYAGLDSSGGMTVV